MTMGLIIFVKHSCHGMSHQSVFKDKPQLGSIDSIEHRALEFGDVRQESISVESARLWLTGDFVPPLEPATSSRVLTQKSFSSKIAGSKFAVGFRKSASPEGQLP